MRYDAYLYPEFDELAAATELTGKFRERILQLLPLNG